ncbi:hypothetical protein MCOR21_006938 [Pyricularia oryzae]|uniref:Small nuclear ribonucleoprotein Prp3 C-terminal domain-containing protein n=1 Tax=Pyricularia grisea TaxID=148305 RepID=A0ABQ8NC85_PYRGI|nr:hypothetical protein MCOR26_004883 [Pyricularia oryzae]KAI6294688.1 hypothetical protein MCOR33_008254 [Pyricularia grisea]KAI6349768.1 hypothetical protein MCOR28_000829 [Pyricularia oryzae]KAI6387357.1 hypothetical protein MCOR32_000505 [Pyricularia oryzae]KAI6402277.1 hypothetical protein MCOR23_003958 [Pyricularia oryzae]
MIQSWLSTDLIELQLGQIDLLLAMYPESTTIDADNHRRAEALRSIVDGSLASDPPASLSLVLSLDLDRTVRDCGSKLDRGSKLELEISFSFAQPDGPVEPPPPRVRVLQPTWLSKADTSSLNASLPPELLADLDKEALEAHVTQTLATLLAPKPSAESQDQPRDLVRVWFYFPSISTRSKRDDLVEHAPRHGLTGFLISGKPGMLCVEGCADDIDAYMRFVRTESWRDIPAAHKKVSERLREAGVQRVFDDMREVDCGDMGGERRGERANRLDMKALETWLVGKGVGDAFAKVFM